MSPLPPGFRLMAQEELKAPLPMDTISYHHPTQQWLPCSMAGKRSFAKVHKTPLATRTGEATQKPCHHPTRRIDEKGECELCGIPANAVQSERRWPRSALWKQDCPRFVGETIAGQRVREEKPENRGFISLGLFSLADRWADDMPLPAGFCPDCRRFRGHGHECRTNYENIHH